MLQPHKLGLGDALEGLVILEGDYQPAHGRVVEDQVKGQHRQPHQIHHFVLPEIQRQALEESLFVVGYRRAVVDNLRHA